MRLTTLRLLLPTTQPLLQFIRQCLQRPISRHLCLSLFRTQFDNLCIRRDQPTATVSIHRLPTQRFEQFTSACQSRNRLISTLLDAQYSASHLDEEILEDNSSVFLGSLTGLEIAALNFAANQSLLSAHDLSALLRSLKPFDLSHQYVVNRLNFEDLAFRNWCWNQQSVKVAAELLSVWRKSFLNTPQDEFIVEVLQRCPLNVLVDFQQSLQQSIREHGKSTWHTEQPFLKRFSRILFGIPDPVRPDLPWEPAVLEAVADELCRKDAATLLEYNQTLRRILQCGFTFSEAFLKFQDPGYRAFFSPFVVASGKIDFSKLQTPEACETAYQCFLGKKRSNRYF